MRLLCRPIWLTRRIPLSRLLQATPHGAVHHTSTTNVAPVELPRLLVKPGSTKHNSLSTYLEYAARTNLRPDRTVYVGTHYEYTAAEALQRLGFTLIRTGMRDDAGIDLIGHWMLTFLREPMPVIVQCKARMKSCSPDTIRELEGAFASVPHDWRNKDVLGLLVSNQKATDGLRRQMHLSYRPLAYLQIDKGGIITQFLWNRAATDRGLEGVGVTPRYTVLPPETDGMKPEVLPKDADDQLTTGPLAKRSKRRPSRTVIADIQLTWMGTPIVPDSAQIARETTRRLAAIQKTFEKDPQKPKRPIGRPRGTSKKLKSDLPKIDTRPLRAKSKPTAVLAEVPKRGRGRPPKVKAAVVAAVPRRGPGRPPKEWKAIWGGDDHGQIAPQPVPPEVRKPRGRPKKVVADTAKIEDTTIKPAGPRKRGRPRKAVAAPD